MAHLFEKDASYCVPLWIDGEAVSNTDSPKIDVTTPPAHEKAWSASTATAKYVDQAIQAASQAFKSWSKTPISNRTEIFKKAAQLLEERREEARYYMKKEIAADDAFVDQLNIPMSVGILKDVSEILEETLKSEVVRGKDGMDATIHKTPYGVVGAIAPW
jgi:aldehyde dehydrogenase (NAD+)